LPYFEVVSDLPELTIRLNNLPLTQTGSNVLDVLADGTELKYEYRFALSQSDVLLLGTNNLLNIDYNNGGSTNDDLSFLMAGPALGDFANGLPGVLPPGIIKFNHGANNLNLTWPDSGTLQSAAEVLGPWSDVVGATNSYSAPFDAPRKFFRLRQ
jgi:hypothetical protein